MDSDHPDVITWAGAHAGLSGDPVDRAVALYQAVRDGFRYDPYQVDLRPDRMTASHLLTRDRGYCIEKANLLGACARVLGIPARLGFADVRNHIGTEKLERLLGTDLLVFHGYAELHLEGRWVKATPAFDRGLCERLGVQPLAFDGRADSIFQEYGDGGYMEYVTDRGTFDDWPREAFEAALRRHYGHLFAGGRVDRRPLRRPD